MHALGIGVIIWEDAWETNEVSYQDLLIGRLLSVCLQTSYGFILEDESHYYVVYSLTVFEDNSLIRPSSDCSFVCIPKSLVRELQIFIPGGDDDASKTPC